MAATFLFVVLPVIVALGLIRKYREYKWGVYKFNTPLDDRVFIITGSNSGIGKETARELAKRNARVILACRDLNNARMAIEDIRKSTSFGELIPMHLDLASFDSIRKFSNEALDKFKKIDVLINNAGVAFPVNSTQKTKEGFEMNFGVNHLGHFLLTQLLLERIKNSAPSRIVIVSSALHQKGSLDINDLNMENKKKEKPNTRFNPAYCASKLANVYHCRELAKRLSGTGVDVFAVCPGFTYTNLFRYSNIKWWTYILLSPIAFFYLRTPWQGAQTVLYCSLEETIRGKSGNFYRDCQLYKSPKEFDPETQIQLWEKSEAMIK